MATFVLVESLTYIFPVADVQLRKVILSFITECHKLLAFSDSFGLNHPGSTSMLYDAL